LVSESIKAAVTISDDGDDGEDADRLPSLLRRSGVSDDHFRAEAFWQLTSFTNVGKKILPYVGGLLVTHDEVKQKLVQVLTTIQTNSGLPCPALDGSLRPAEHLEKFNSKVWPAAIGMLSAELNFEIDDDVNIFSSRDGTVAYTIDEVTDLICKLANGTTTTRKEEVPR
jgi:hypothetical protein